MDRVKLDEMIAALKQAQTTRPPLWWGKEDALEQVLIARNEDGLSILLQDVGVSSVAEANELLKVFHSI